MGRGKKRAAPGRPFWKEPGAVVFALAVVLLGGGGLMVFREAQRTSPALEGRIDELAVTLQQARWMTDHMDHGGGFTRPPSMMPDMPEVGAQRLSVELSFKNAGRRVADYRGEEFSLVNDGGETWIVQGADLGAARLRSGQSLNATLYFDIDTETADPGRLRLLWQRGDESVYMPLPAPPEHDHAQPRGDVAWPADAEILLPIGNFERGEVLYSANYACIACHGEPSRAGSNLVGPHLGTVATAATVRVEGQGATQYLYESILRPNAFIAPECRDGRPCTAPSAMPDYAEILSLQDMADLVTYLLRQTG